MRSTGRPLNWQTTPPPVRTLRAVRMRMGLWDMTARCQSATFPGSCKWKHHQFSLVPQNIFFCLSFGPAIRAYVGSLFHDPLHHFLSNHCSLSFLHLSIKEDWKECCFNVNLQNSSFPYLSPSGPLFSEITSLSRAAMSPSLTPTMMNLKMVP